MNKLEEQSIPPQTQAHQPGIESEMTPLPEAEKSSYKGSGKLQKKVAFITGGDSGIGKAVAIAFAKEGADIAISYLDEHTDANKTQEIIRSYGRQCLLLPADIKKESCCEEIINVAVKEFKKLDVLVNNAAIQYQRESIEDITAEQLEEVFAVNFFSMVYLTKAALHHMPDGGAIINSTSVNAYIGNADVLDYTCTKGAIVAFTRSMSKALLARNIRVNAVAPGPIWTPLIPSTISKEKMSSFHKEAPMKRAGQPAEIAPCYVFLASEDASYMTGQVLHPNGGTIVNG